MCSFVAIRVTPVGGYGILQDFPTNDLCQLLDVKSESWVAGTGNRAKLKFMTIPESGFHAGADWMLQTWDRFCRTWNYATFMNFVMFCLHISLQFNADPGTKPFESGQSAQWFPSNMFFCYSHVVCDTTFHEPVRNLSCHQSTARLRGQNQNSFNEIFMNYGHT